MSEPITRRETKRKLRILSLWQERFQGKPVLADELFWAYSNSDIEPDASPTFATDSLRRSLFRTIRGSIKFAQLWHLPQVDTLPVGLIVRAAAFRSGATQWVTGAKLLRDRSIRLKREKTFFGQRPGGMLRVEFCSEDEFGWVAHLSACFPYSTPILAMADRQPSVDKIFGFDNDPCCRIWLRKSTKQRYWIGAVCFYARSDENGAGYEEIYPKDNLPEPVPYTGP